MIAEGQVVLFRFPQTDQQVGKLRPALIVRELPARYNDWLICMISSSLDKEIPGFDEIIAPNDLDFRDSAKPDKDFQTRRGRWRCPRGKDRPDRQPALITNKIKAISMDTTCVVI